MGCCDVQGLMPLETGLERLLAAIEPVATVEERPLAHALGAVSARDITGEAPVPGFDNSAMDGYALRHADLANDDGLLLQGRAMAGAPFDETVRPGHCVRIMTGARIPDGCDTVIMQERATVDADRVRFSEHPEPGNNIRRAGEDIQPGDVVVPSGRRLTAVDLALLATVGCETVPVRRTVRVGLFSSGDELRQPGELLGPGDLYDSNRPGVRAMLERLGVTVIDLGVVPDNRDALRQAFQTADAGCDVVVSSGGVSVGEADYTKDILGELGDIEFWKLAIKPGKPFAFGRLPNSWFIGLPGNPVSAMVTFHVLGAAAIRALSGLPHRPLDRLTARTTRALRKSPGRVDLQRGRWFLEGDDVRVEPANRGQGSHILTSLADANCYIALERDRGPVEAGEPVTLWLFDDLLRS